MEEKKSFKDKLIGRVLESILSIKSHGIDAVGDADVVVTAKGCHETKKVSVTTTPSKGGCATTQVAQPTADNTAVTTVTETVTDFEGEITFKINYNYKGDFTIGR